MNLKRTGNRIRRGIKLRMVDILCAPCDNRSRESRVLSNSEISIVFRFVFRVTCATQISLLFLEGGKARLCCFLSRFIGVRGKRGIRGIWKGINLREIERFDIGVFFFLWKRGYWDIDVKLFRDSYNFSKRIFLFNDFSF